MFVGETGVRRMVQRSCDLAGSAPGGDVRAAGGIDLETLQKYVNFWYSISIDLFGGEISSNAADYFASGLKGRAGEKKYDDHRALEGSYDMMVPEQGRLVTQSVPQRNAMNEVLRDAYVEDNQRGVDMWNRTIAEAGLDFRFKLPARSFNRSIGIYAGMHITPEGEPISEADWNSKRDQWLPSQADREYVAKLMQPVRQPGKMANWIAAPSRGVDGKPLEFEYVRLD